MSSSLITQGIVNKPKGGQVGTVCPGAIKIRPKGCSAAFEVAAELLSQKDFVIGEIAQDVCLQISLSGAPCTLTIKDGVAEIDVLDFGLFPKLAGPYTLASPGAITLTVCAFDGWETVQTEVQLCWSLPAYLGLAAGPGPYTPGEILAYDTFASADGTWCQEASPVGQYVVVAYPSALGVTEDNLQLGDLPGGMEVIQTNLLITVPGVGLVPYDVARSCHLIDHQIGTPDGFIRVKANA